jgi:DNA-binding NarL/FixJ family response regulator
MSGGVQFWTACLIALLRRHDLGGNMDSISVLLVDDSPLFLRIATRFLQEYYHDEVVVVGTASGGQEALTKARDLRPQVVLLDLAMPDLPGLEVIPYLRAASPEVGIVVVTLLDTDGYRLAAQEAGADAFVPKASLSIDLLPAIRRVVQADQPLEKPVDGSALEQNG